MLAGTLGPQASGLMLGQSSPPSSWICVQQITAVRCCCKSAVLLACCSAAPVPGCDRGCDTLTPHSLFARVYTFTTLSPPPVVPSRQTTETGRWPAVTALRAPTGDGSISPERVVLLSTVAFHPARPLLLAVKSVFIGRVFLRPAWPWLGLESDNAALLCTVTVPSPDLLVL